VRKSIVMVMFCAAFGVSGGAFAQGMMMDFLADQVIKKFEGATCAQLRLQKGQPKSLKEKEAIAFLRNDSQARVAFLDKVAPPVANKLFECGLIP
jgi:hypothetical protein